MFVPTHRVTPRLITLNAHIPRIPNTDELLRSNIHVAVVRGYQFGPAFESLVGRLALQGRLHVGAAPDDVVKLLSSDRVDAAILPLSAMADAVEAADLGNRFRSNILTDLPRVRIGFYISTSSLSESDRTVLRKAITRAVNTGEYQRLMRRHYPSWSLPDVTSD